MIHNDYERLITAIGSLEGVIDDLIEAVNALVVVMAKTREDERSKGRDDKSGIREKA